MGFGLENRLAPGAVSALRNHVIEEKTVFSRPLLRRVSWGEYWGNADFWDRSLQNWQSEFLAIGTMAVFTVYLRQRGSPESKPVGAPHDATGESN
jgi:hypothetical protein